MVRTAACTALVYAMGGCSEEPGPNFDLAVRDWSPNGRELLANPNPGAWARATRHKVELRIGQKTRGLTTELDRHCCAGVWDAGCEVTFQGVTSGLWIYEVERERLTRAGQGVHATVSGYVVVFETSRGDGHHFAHSALKMVMLGATPMVTALQTPENTAWPALGPNGRLACVTPAGLFTARLPVRE